MAARSVRCLLSNQTDSPMKLEDTHHDSGQFTDPWYPPATVGPQQIVEWRSESDGVMTGAVGSAKYSVFVSGQDLPNQEMFVEISWDNPYIGTNSSNITVTPEFAGRSNPNLQATHFIQSGGSPPNAVKVAGVDLEAWLDTLLFPPYILANAVSYNDAVALYGIKLDAPPQQFIGQFAEPGPGPRNLRLNVNIKPQEWSGDWSSKDVHVTLQNNGGMRMTAGITDRTSTPVLEFTQDFELGHATWVARHAVSSMIHKQLSGEISAPLAKTLSTEALRIMSAPGAHPASTIADRFHRLATSAAETSANGVSSPSLKRLGSAIALIIASRSGTIALMHGVHLSLYDVFIGKTKQTQVLLYQRLDAADNILISRQLDFHPELR